MPWRDIFMESEKNSLQLNDFNREKYYLEGVMYSVVLNFVCVHKFGGCSKPFICVRADLIYFAK